MDELSREYVFNRTGATALFFYGRLLQSFCAIIRETELRIIEAKKLKNI
jgi:hypothetical protein